MTMDVKKSPSHGRITKLLTDLGPYFRRLNSTESSYFFDCLEICVDDQKEPEEREFLGWWMIVKKQEDSFEYERFNGRYNLPGNWVDETIYKKNQQQLDNSFELFLARLETLLEVETELPLNLREVVCSEV
ncbi:transcriptional regulator Crl [Psychromonas ingrahamii 37]|uniref:Sigma factor-binding protein Crl n=1 Tax=Psychromonas ingrahamii (strain DSM 17664 / CCUG 51855 / 37) TaxID=357804 RepID=A1SYU1_PSYIN|nr:sigma factor-binding protein Crl [Psychromonas ingrahamii]ABM04656.1 transcriptional regulator Crl [Psychromonas ingrahamii 37]